MPATSLKRQFIEGSAALIVGNGLQAIVAFAVNLVLVAFILPEEFGTFAILMAKLGLVFAFLSVRTNTLVVRASEKTFTAERQSLYFSIAVYELLLVIIVGTVIILLLPNNRVIGLILLMALALRHWTDMNRAFFERGMPYKSLAVVEAGSNICSHFAALGAAVVGAGVHALFIREIALSVLSILTLWRIGGLTLRPLMVPDRHQIVGVYREARGLWLDNLLQSTFTNLTMLIAGYTGGTTVAGYFFQAQKFALLPHMLLSPMASRVIMNWFSRLEERDARQKARDKVLLVTLVTLAGATAPAVYFADTLFPWMLGEVWSPVAVIFQGLVGYIVFLTAFEILRSYAVAEHRTWDLNVARSLLHIPLAFPVINLHFQLVGVGLSLAIAQSVAVTFGAIALYVMLKRQK